MSFALQVAKCKEAFESILLGSFIAAVFQLLVERHFYS